MAFLKAGAGVPGPDPTPSPRTETQTKILAAALEVFAERGFAAATTAEVARRAGVAEKTLFAHFKSKDALFQQTLTPATLELLIPEHTSLFSLLNRDWDRLDQFLTELFRNRIAVFEQHPHKFKLVVQELLLRPELVAPFRETFVCKMEPLFKDVFDGLRRKGELGDVSTDTVRRMCIASLFGYALHRFVLRPDLTWDDEREIREMVRVLTTGLRSRERTEKPPADKGSAGRIRRSGTRRRTT